MYIYPDNLKAKATLWLWELWDYWRGSFDFCIRTDTAPFLYAHCFHSSIRIFNNSI